MTAIVAVNGDMPKRSGAKNIAVAAKGLKSVAAIIAKPNASSRDAPIAKPNTESKNHTPRIATKSTETPARCTVLNADDIVELAKSIKVF